MELTPTSPYGNATQTAVAAIRSSNKRSVLSGETYTPMRTAAVLSEGHAVLGWLRINETYRLYRQQPVT